MPVNISQPAGAGKKTIKQPAKATSKAAPKKTTSKSANKPADGQKEPPAWMYVGKDAQKVMHEEQARAEAARDEANRMRQFYLKAGGTAQVTFIDGYLNDEDELDIPMFYIHRKFISGRWRVVLCTGKLEPCPVCEGDERPQLVGVMTIINHTPYEIKGGPNKGKVLGDRNELFVAARTAVLRLQKIAVKQGGLNGVTMEIDRESDNDPRVGGLFQVMQKRSLKEIAKEYGAQLAQVADYEAELPYLPADELKKLGIGVTDEPIGGDQEDADDIPF